MPRTDSAILEKYYEDHPNAWRWEVYLWTHLANRTDAANRITFAYEDWLLTDRSAPPPDLVEWFAIYGYINLRLLTWKLPIKLTAEEVVQWQTAGYYITLDDFQNALASVAAGVAHAAGVDPQLTTQIMRRQLDEKLVEMERLTHLPLSQYTPRRQDWQIRADIVEKHGLKGAALDDAVEESLLESDHMFEVREFEKPFTLRQQLESFEWGMECLRLIVLGENAPELGLPNKKLFDALMQIDLNGLIARLHKSDEQLRRILQNLAKYKCYCLNADHEPEKFWWRHYKQ